MRSCSILTGSSWRVSPSSRRQPGHVGVHRDALVDAEGVAQHDVRGLAAHAGQHPQLLHGVGHLAAVVGDQRLRHADQAPRLVAEEPGGPDDAPRPPPGRRARAPAAWDSGRRTPASPGSPAHRCTGRRGWWRRGAGRRSRGRGRNGRRGIRALSRRRITFGALRPGSLRLAAADSAGRVRRTAFNAGAGRRRRTPRPAGVEDVVRAQPSLARHADAELHVAECRPRCARRRRWRS